MLDNKDRNNNLTTSNRLQLLTSKHGPLQSETNEKCKQWI
jgi:hypothetical protein